MNLLNDTYGNNKENSRKITKINDNFWKRYSTKDVYEWNQYNINYGLDAWNSRNSGTSTDLTGITYANNLFVAVGYSGTILISSDGITWTSRTSGIGNYYLWGITYGNNLFVAVGLSGIILNSNETSKGTLIGTTTSNSSTNYPTDGISGNYWYTYSRAYKSPDVYLNTVSSTNASTYPDNGVGSDGYYYIKQ